MRALLDDPAAVTERQYRRFVQRAQLAGLFPDYLVQGEPYPALNAVVLEAADSALLGRLTEVFSRAFHRAGRALAADVPRLVELGFPWVAAELLAAETPRLPIIGRFDFVRDRAGHWWLLEFNADTPSGVREAVALDALVHARLGADRLARPSARLAPALVEAFDTALADLPPGSAFGLVTTVPELEDLAQMAFTRELLRPRLAARGVEVVLGDVDNVRAARRRLLLRGRQVAALYRYVPFEDLLGSRAFAAIYDALDAGRLRLLNGLYGLLLQHKGLVAWLWQHRDDPAFAADERAAIQAHLAPTWLIADSPPDLPRAALVAKQVFGREGEEVFFGEDAPDDLWQTLTRRRTYVVQRRIDVAQLPAAIPTSGGPRRQVGRATVGAFAVAGRPAGYYTRFGGKIITSRSKWLATFVDEAGTRSTAELAKHAEKALRDGQNTSLRDLCALRDLCG